MKKTVLNRMGHTIATLMVGVAVCATATTTAWAQASVDEAFARELKLVEGLKVYNDQLAKQLEAQNKAKAEIRASIAQAGSLGPQVTPILTKMLTALEQFIRADLPFKMDERLESVAELKALMVNSEASDSDRFRNIMDIYTVETEYGDTYEAYPSTVTIDGTETPVDMLRIGRLALYYQTKDQKNSGMWDKAANAWKPLDSGYNRQIRKAIKVAAKTVAPELLSLPIQAPEGV
jgi:hypothetical protein